MARKTPTLNSQGQTAKGAAPGYLLSVYDTVDSSVDFRVSQAFREIVDIYVQVQISGLTTCFCPCL